MAVPERVKANPHSGGASYRYPIVAPPGTGGMTPQLELRYSSLTKHTEYGFGWTLNLSKIERCTRLGPPTYVFAQDEFELDGDLLVRDPTDPNRFHLRNNDYRRVIYDPATDTWEVTAPDGTRSRYGSFATSKLTTDGAGSGDAFRWHLDEVIDPRGNSYKVLYEQDLEDHDEDGTADYAVYAYPRRVYYSFHPDLAGPIPDAQQLRLIELRWEDRPLDRPTSYRFGAKVQINRRLTDILVGIDSSGGVPAEVDPAEQIRSYKLEYYPTPWLDEPEHPAFAQLKSIQRFGTDPTTPFPSATEFEYTRPQRGFLAGAPWGGSAGAGHIRHGLHLSTLRGVYDLDGDGFPDRIRVSDWTWMVAYGLPDGTGFGPESPWTWTCPDGPNQCVSAASNRIAATVGDAPWHFTGADLVDMDGDGLLDRIVSSSTGTWVICPNTGSKFDACVPWTPPQPPGDSRQRNIGSNLQQGNPPTTRGMSSLVDVNGDGRPDHVAGNSIPAGDEDRIWVSLNNGAGFDAAQLWHLPNQEPGTFGYSTTQNPTWRTSTVTVLYFPPPLGGASVVYGVTGHVFVDVNGDGLPDEVPTCASGFNTSYGLGSGWQYPAGTGHWKQANGDWVGECGGLPPDWAEASRFSATEQLLTDLNGDGFVDKVTGSCILNNPGDSWGVVLGRGDGTFGPCIYWSVPPNTIQGLYGTGSPRMTNSEDGHVTIDLLDIDGDGLLDRVVEENNAWTVWRHPGPPGLLTNVTNELGGVTQLEYDSSTAFSTNAAESASRPYAPETLPATTQARRDPFWAVSRITTSDGRVGTAVEEQDLQYAEFRFETALREHLGARMAESRDAADTLTRTLFHQTLELKARVELEEVIAADGTLYRGRETDWSALAAQNESAQAVAGSFFAAPLEERSWIADPTDPGLRRERRLTRDFDERYGRMLWEVDHGADISPGATADDLKTEFDYQTNDTLWLVSYANERRRLLADGTLLEREITVYDDGLTLTKGLVTERSVQADDLLLLTERFEYDTDPQGNPIEPAAGRVTRYWDPEQLATDPLTASVVVEYETTYNTFATTATNAFGHATHYEVDPGTGDVLKLMEPTQRLSCWDYDGFGRLSGRRDKSTAASSITEACDRQLASFGFVDLGLTDSPDRQHVLATLWADATQNVESRQYFDGLGRVYGEANQGRASVADDFAIARREWGARGELLCEWLPSRGPAEPGALPAGYPGCPDPTVESPENRRIFSYDALLRPLTTHHGTTLETTISYAIGEHDGLPGLELIERRTDHATPVRYREIAQNPQGAVVSVCEDLDASGSCDPDALTLVRRDAKQRITLVDGPDVRLEGGGTDENLLALSYDQADRRTRLVLPPSGADLDAGRTWTYVHDRNGNLIEETPPRGGAFRIDYYYDDLGRLRLKDFAPHQGLAVPGSEDTEIVYDEGPSLQNLGRVTTEVTPGLTTSYAWDLRGVSPDVTQSFPGGPSFTLQSSVDLLERPLRTSFPDGEAVSIRYDGALADEAWLERFDETQELLLDEIAIHPSGLIEKIRHAGPGITSERSFELADAQRLSSIRTLQGATPVQDLDFDYDPAGNLTCITNLVDDPSQCEQTFGYDGGHRLTSATDVRTSGYGDLIFGYDPAGNLRRKGPHGLRYGADGAGPHAVTSLALNTYEDSTTIDDPCPSYEGEDLDDDPDGDGIPRECQCGDADGNGFISSVDAFKVIQFMNACAGDPVCLGNPPPLYDTNLDGFANSVDAFNISSKVGSDTAFELVCARRPEGTPVWEDLYTYEYNADGQVEARNLGAGPSYAFTWDSEHQMTAVSGSAQATYAYGAAGRRIRKTQTSGDDILFVMRSYEVNLTAITHTKHIFVEGQRVLSIEQDGIGDAPAPPQNESRVHYFPDQVGTNILATDGTGNVLHRSVLDPFGGLTAVLDANGNPLGSSGLASSYLYTDHHFEQESGLHYMGSRYYDPLAGRFLSTDPELLASAAGATFSAITASPQQLNAYTYALNRPTVAIDPTGRSACINAAMGICGGNFQRGSLAAAAGLLSPFAAPPTPRPPPKPEQPALPDEEGEEAEEDPPTPGEEILADPKKKRAVLWAVGGVYSAVLNPLPGDENKDVGSFVFASEEDIPDDNQEAVRRCGALLCTAPSPTAERGRLRTTGLLTRVQVKTSVALVIAQRYATGIQIATWRVPYYQRLSKYVDAPVFVVGGGDRVTYMYEVGREPVRVER